MEKDEFEAALENSRLSSLGEFTKTSLVEAFSLIHMELKEALKHMVPQSLPEYKNLEWRLDIDVSLYSITLVAKIF